MKKKLPKVFKKKWLKALRSGDYEQTDSALVSFKNKDIEKPMYCCLGVACKIAGHNPISLQSSGWITGPLKKGVPHIISGSGESDVEDTNTVAKKLAEMNDDGYSFKQIANYIQKNL